MMDLVVVNKGKTQNSSRQEAYGAAYNLAAMMHAVQDLQVGQDATEGRLKGHDVYNIDD